MTRPFRPRTPGVRQRDITDCGAACLASVAAYHGLRVPVARIRLLAATDERGTNVLGLLDAAQRLGLTAKAVRGPVECLSAIPKPAIAHLVVEGGLHHFVVIYGVKGASLTVMDPRDGRARRFQIADFTRSWTGILVLLAPNEAFSPRDERRSRLRTFIQLLQPHRAILLQALLGALVYTLLGLSSAVFVQKVVDHVLSGGNRNLLNLLGLGMLALLIVQLYLGAAKDVFVLRVGQRIDGVLIMGYYRHLFRLPQRFFDTMRVGEVISRVGDAVKIRVFLNEVCLELVVNVFIVAFATGLMFIYSWRLALVMVAAIPLYGLVYGIANRVNRETQREVMERAADLESQLVESVTAAGTIRRFGIEEHAAMAAEQRLVRLLRGVYRAGTTQIFSSTATDFISRLTTLLVLWIGAVMVIDRSLSPGGLMSFYALAGYLSSPVVRLIGMNRTLQDALIAADRLFEIMDLERDEDATQRIEVTPGGTGPIRFEAVGFRYGTRTKVFDGLDLTIQPGTLTAIVGESGCGKSTIASLLQKVYLVQTGAIRIGGIDFRNLDAGSLRRLIAVVPQELHLFAGTVIENIAVGDSHPDLRRVLLAADEAGVTEFVERLPGGFEGRIGERGASLSGGERQRIAIARALYRQPRILILDEATSSLDPASEARVRAAAERFRERGGTAIVIAHRLSLVAGADRIVVLGGGRVIEEGKHADLVRAGGAYAALWSQQAGGVGADGPASQTLEAVAGGASAA